MPPADASQCPPCDRVDVHQSVPGPTDVPRTDILIVTYAKDADWLGYCLKAIRKHCRGFGSVVVVHEQRGAKHGYLRQQIYKCFADVYCQDAAYVMHVDSDCIFTAAARPDDYFIDKKPVLLREKYDRLRVPWRLPTEKALGVSCEYETMRRHPAVHPVSLYERLRAHVERVHGKQFADYVLRQAPPSVGFSEFNCLGAFALHYHAPDYHWIDVGADARPPDRLRQFWSYDGTAKHREWLDRAVRDDTPDSFDDGAFSRRSNK